MTLLPSRRPGFPERIVCMTEETTETLYLLGEDWRIVGISGFTVRPPQARREKPKVSTFTSADIGAIASVSFLALEVVWFCSKETEIAWPNKSGNSSIAGFQMTLLGDSS